MKSRARRDDSRRLFVWGMGALTVLACVFAYSIGAAPESSSQLAVGIAADMECTGNYDPNYQYPKVNPKTKKQGIIGKPCKDVTSGFETEGKCQALGKCKGEKTDGMMPMLPMLPMPMPMMSMPMPPNCPPSGTATTSTSTAASADPNCPPTGSSGGLLSGVSQWLFGASNNSASSASTDASSSESSGSTGSAPRSTWSQLLNLVGISAPQTNSSSNTGSSNTSGANTQSPTVPVTVSGSNAGGLTSTKTITPSGTGVSQDLSHLSTQTTFSYTGSSGQKQETATILEGLASTLRKMLAMVRGWTE